MQELPQSDGPLESSPSRPCAPGEHRWVLITYSHGDVFGVDSQGDPVWVPSPQHEMQCIITCNECDENWTTETPLTKFAS